MLYPSALRAYRDENKEVVREAIHKTLGTGTPDLNKLLASPLVGGGTVDLTVQQLYEQFSSLLKPLLNGESDNGDDQNTSHTVGELEEIFRQRQEKLHQLIRVEHSLYSRLVEVYTEFLLIRPDPASGKTIDEIWDEIRSDDDNAIETMKKYQGAPIKYDNIRVNSPNETPLQILNSLVATEEFLKETIRVYLENLSEVLTIHRYRKYVKQKEEAERILHHLSTTDGQTQVDEAWIKDIGDQYNALMGHLERLQELGAEPAVDTGSEVSSDLDTLDGNQSGGNATVKEEADTRDEQTVKEEAGTQGDRAMKEEKKPSGEEDETKSMGHPDNTSLLELFELERQIYEILGGDTNQLGSVNPSEQELKFILDRLRIFTTSLLKNVRLPPIFQEITEKWKSLQPDRDNPYPLFLFPIQKYIDDYVDNPNASLVLKNLLDVLRAPSILNFFDVYCRAREDTSRLNEIQRRVLLSNDTEALLEEFKRSKPGELTTDGFVYNYSSFKILLKDHCARLNTRLLEGSRSEQKAKNDQPGDDDSDSGSVTASGGGSEDKPENDQPDEDDRASSNADSAYFNNDPQVVVTYEEMAKTAQTQGDKRLNPRASETLRDEFHKIFDDKLRFHPGRPYRVTISNENPVNPSDAMKNAMKTLVDLDRHVRGVISSRPFYINKTRSSRPRYLIVLKGEDGLLPSDSANGKDIFTFVKDNTKLAEKFKDVIHTGTLFRSKVLPNPFSDRNWMNESVGVYNTSGERRMRDHKTDNRFLLAPGFAVDMYVLYVYDEDANVLCPIPMSLMFPGVGPDKLPVTLYLNDLAYNLDIMVEGWVKSVPDGVKVSEGDLQSAVDKMFQSLVARNGIYDALGDKLLISADTQRVVPLPDSSAMEAISPLVAWM